MTVAHSTLTGADLHEPKGAAAASANTVYVADGAASGAWAKITSSSLDATSILNINTERYIVTLTDVSTASSIYLPFSKAGTVSKVTSALGGTIATADSTITCRNASGTSMGTLTIAYSGSAGGDIDTLTPASNNTFTAGTAMKIETDGASSNTISITFMIDYTLT